MQQEMFHQQMCKVRLSGHCCLIIVSQAASGGARETETVFSGDFQSGYEWASVVKAATASTPVAIQRRNRFTALGSTTDDDERH